MCVCVCACASESVCMSDTTAMQVGTRPLHSICCVCDCACAIVYVCVRVCVYIGHLSDAGGDQAVAQHLLCV